jgi:hypothetical protein
MSYAVMSFVFIAAIHFPLVIFHLSLDQYPATASAGGPPGLCRPDFEARPSAQTASLVANEMTNDK